MSEQLFAMHRKGHCPWFEGWYVHVSDSAVSFGVIFGVSYTKQQTHAFVQYLDDQSSNSIYQSYPFSAFSMQKDGRQVQIGENVLSMHHLHVRLPQVSCDIAFYKPTPLSHSIYAPDIMGPFHYLPMQCTHAILSLHHQAIGTLQRNNHLVSIHGIGYMEKDWGSSFPAYYQWFQSNCCTMANKACFFYSHAHIPLGPFHFTGVICVLMIQDKQLRFATYHGCRFTQVDAHTILLRQQSQTMKLRFSQREGASLMAPQKGSMERKIKETLSASVTITLYEGQCFQKQWVFTKGGMEVVQKDTY